jgi:Arm DNA-binding domain
MKGGIRPPRTAGGTWAYRIDLGRGSDGRRSQRQVAGFRSREEAEAALAEMLAGQGGGDSRTVAGFLERVWLPAKRAEVGSGRRSISTPGPSVGTFSRC